MKVFARLACSALLLVATRAEAQTRWAQWVRTGIAPVVQVVAGGCLRLQEDSKTATHLAATPVTVNRVGTGFLYATGGKTVVITARHVVMGCGGGLTMRPMRGEQVLLGESDRLAARLQGCNKDNDFAVLDLPERAWPAALTSLPGPPPNALDMVGIPWGASTVQVTSLALGALARLDMHVNEDQLPAFQVLGSPTAGTKLYRLNGTARRGESGGPLLSWTNGKPFVRGMTVAHLQDLAFYLPIETLNAELGRVDIQQCDVPRELQAQLPMPAGSLPHVTESSESKCELGTALLKESHLSHEDLFDAFVGRAKPFKEIRKKIGLADQDQSFSLLKFDGIDLVVPEADAAQTARDMFIDGCRIVFRPRPQGRPQSYVAELVVVPSQLPAGARDVFDLGRWSPTQPLWSDAPESYTLDRVDRVQEQAHLFTETLAFVARRVSGRAQIFYLAKWDPADSWKRACQQGNPLDRSEEKSCERDRLNFVAFTEAVHLVNKLTGAASSEIIPPAPRNQLQAPALNQIQ